MAWVGVVAVPLLLLAVAVGWRDGPPLLLQLAGGAFVASCAVLLWRLPHSRDPSDDDPGAVV